MSDGAALSEAEIESRYRRVYGVGADVGIAEAMFHWKLERRLTERLLKSSRENRWAEFEACYTELYSSLPWLNATDPAAASSDRYVQWGKLIRPGSRVFEVGSGKAELLRYLARQGCECVATEITRERGAKHARGEANLVWKSTDGINLAAFEAENSYDVVISTDVIEHLHPDDIELHFENVRKILTPGGRYIFTTPHPGSGPHDLSRVFGCEKPVCMHLQEYDYLRLSEIISNAGFRAPSAVFPPAKMFHILGWARESRTYFNYLHACDRIDRGWTMPRRRMFRKVMKIAAVPDAVWVSAESP